VEKTGGSNLPPAARKWVAQNRRLIELVASHVRREGAWPQRTALQRKMLNSPKPVALAPIFAEMPRIVGFVRGPDDQIVLTLFGLAETLAGRPLVDAFVDCLRVAAARYREDEHASMRRADIEPLALEPAERLALAEILLREAPFLGSGQGGHGEDWGREVTEDIVRYWDDRTADDYLRRRSTELRSNPLFGWPGLESASGESRSGEVPDESVERGPGAVPPWAPIFLSIIVALSAVFSLVLGVPRPFVVGSLAMAFAGALVWRRGFRWPPGLVQLALVLAAGVLGAGIALMIQRDSHNSVSPRPTRTQAAVAGYVSFTTHRAMDWLRDPTVHQPSVQYFEAHFSALDPQRPHKFDIRQANVVVDVPTLVQRAPELSGVLLRVRGKLAQSSEVAAYRKATSWALILREPGVPRMIAVCRVPLARGDEDAYQPGNTIHANGVLLADGGVPRADGKGSVRVAYLACASVAKTIARIGIVLPRKSRK